MDQAVSKQAQQDILVGDSEYDRLLRGLTSQGSFLSKHSFTSGTVRPSQGGNLIQVADRQNTYHAIGVSTSLSSALHSKASTQASGGGGGGSASLSFAQQLYASASSKPAQINIAQSTISSSIVGAERQTNNNALPPALSVSPSRPHSAGSPNDSLRSNEASPSATEFHRIPRNSVPKPSGGRSPPQNTSQNSSRGATANPHPNRGAFHVFTVSPQPPTDIGANAIPHRTQSHNPVPQSPAQVLAMPVHHHATAPAPARSGTPRGSPNLQAAYPSPPSSASSSSAYVESPPYTPLPSQPSPPLLMSQPPSYELIPDTPRSVHSPSPTSNPPVPSSPRSRGSRTPERRNNQSPIARGLSAPTTIRGATPGPTMTTTTTASRGLGSGNDNGAVSGLSDSFRNFTMGDDGNSGGSGGFGFDQFGSDNGSSFGQIGSNDSDSLGQVGGDGGLFGQLGNGNEDGGYDGDRFIIYSPPTPSYESVDSGYQRQGPYAPEVTASPRHDGSGYQQYSADSSGQYVGDQGHHQNDGDNNSGNEWQSQQLSNHQQTHHPQQHQHQHQQHQQSPHAANSGQSPSAYTQVSQQAHQTFQQQQQQQQYYPSSASQGQQSTLNVQQTSNQHYASHSTPNLLYPPGGGGGGVSGQAHQHTQQHQSQNTNFIPPSNHAHQQYASQLPANSPLQQQPGLGGFCGHPQQQQHHPYSASTSPPPNQIHRPHTVPTSPNPPSRQSSPSSGGSGGQSRPFYLSPQPRYQHTAPIPSAHAMPHPFISTPSPVAASGLGATPQLQAQSYQQPTFGTGYAPSPGFSSPTTPNAPGQPHPMAVSPPHGTNTYPIVGLPSAGFSSTSASSSAGQPHPHANTYPIVGPSNNGAYMVPAQYSQTTFQGPSQSPNGTQEQPKDPDTGINAQKIVQYAKTAASVAGVAVKIFQAAETLTGTNNSGSNNVFF